MPDEIRRTVPALVGGLALLSVAGCAQNVASSVTVPVVAQSTGSLQLSTPQDQSPPPSLGDLESLTPEGSSVDAKEQAKLQKLQQTALVYGLQGGLAHGIAQIDGIVRSQSDFLTRTYNFGDLMIDAPYGTRILPPVIVESKDIYDQVDPDTVVIADHTYKILSPAAFAPVQPLWQTYLIMPWTSPSTQSVKDFPDSALEHQTWDAALKKGYEMGQAQAFSEFQINLNSLNREYLGMIRWSRLVATGEATSPTVTSEMKSVVGGGDSVTIKERL